MPLPKAPNRMGQMLDIAEASTQKAQPPAKARTRARSADKAVKTAAADKAVHAEAATEARVLTDTGRPGQRKPMAAVLTSASGPGAAAFGGYYDNPDLHAKLQAAMALAPVQAQQ